MSSTPNLPVEQDLTGLLNLGLAGDPAANEHAFGAVYDELRHSALRAVRRGGDGLTLSPTALVSEVYLKLGESAPRSVNDRAHFYSLAARAMRQVLIDHQRGKYALKRGGDVLHVELTAEPFGDSGDSLDYFALEQALEALKAVDKRAASVVDWHFFSGLNFLEIAELLGISDKTARRDWDSARAFLLLQLSHR